MPTSPSLIQMPALTNNQTTQLSVLGCLFREGKTLKQLMSALQRLETGIWQPTTEVVLSAIEKLDRAAHILALDLGRDQVYIITTRGMQAFEILMGAPLPRQSGLRCQNVALKSAFLDHLPKAYHPTILAQLIQHYECELQSLHTACQGCPMAQTQHHNKPTAQMQHLETELQWLLARTNRLEQPQTYPSVALN